MVTPPEKRWCLVYSALLAVATSLPYLVAFQAQGRDWVFTGFVFGVEDGNSYVAKMLQGAGGAWLFRSTYSSQETPGLLAFLPYLLLGKLAAGDEIHLQLVALFHVARVVLIPVAVWATYRFAAVFLAEASSRRWATVVATAGGGVGWVLAALGRPQVLDRLPLDFYSPESFGFLAFYGLPHLLLAKALVLNGLVIFFRDPGDPARGRLAGGLLLAAGLAQPLTVLAVYALIGVHLALALVKHRKARLSEALRRDVPPAAWAVGLSFPIAGYYALGAWIDPSLRQWIAQNVLTSPHPAHYLLGYGWVLVPAIVGAGRFLRAAHPGRALVWWFVILVGMAYLPVTVQRRLIDGAWLALAILAAHGFETARTTTPTVGLARRGVLAASLGTAVLLLVGGAWTAARPGMPLFRPAGEVAAFVRLGERARPGSVVLGSFATGNALPAWAPLRSVVGHGPETANLQVLLPRVERFFGRAMSPDERRTFLEDQAVDFVFYGPAERDLGGWGPRPPSMLVEFLREGEYAVYEVAGP